MDSTTCFSKNDLLEWLRTSFNYPISKVEECGNGVVYLLIMDALYPGKVPLRKIKYNAKQEWECLHNLKLLQTVFMEQGIKKNLDIDRLAKCVYTDNLEFLQWIKRFYDRYSCNQINGLRHINSSHGEPVLLSSGSTAASNSAKQQTSTGTVQGLRHENSSTRTQSVKLRSVHTPALNQRSVTGTQLMRKDVSQLEEELEKLREMVKQRDEEIEVLREELRDTEAESRFYFGKLRAFEMLAVDPERKGFTIPEVETILFSEDNFTEEELVEAVLNCSKAEKSTEFLPGSNKAEVYFQELKSEGISK